MSVSFLKCCIWLEKNFVSATGKVRIYARLDSYGHRSYYRNVMWFYNGWLEAHAKTRFLKHINYNFKHVLKTAVLMFQFFILFIQLILYRYIGCYIDCISYWLLLLVIEIFIWYISHFLKSFILEIFPILTCLLFETVRKSHDRK